MSSFTTPPPPPPWTAPQPAGNQPPRFPDKGTWPPGPYRSAQRRTTVASVSHAIAAFAAVVGAYVTLQVFPLLDKADRFQLTMAEEEAWIESFEAVTGFESITAFIAIVTLMMWLSRSVDNTPALGGGIARRGPRWAIGVWFIPIVNVVMPALILRDLARRISQDGKGHDRLVLAWWLIYWGPVVLGIYSAFLPAGGTDSVRDSYTLVFVIGLVNALGYIMTIVVMRRLQQDADFWTARQEQEREAARFATTAAPEPPGPPRSSDGGWR